MTDELESDLEAQATWWAETWGWYAVKIMRTSKRGFPDHYFLRKGRTLLVEFKRSDDVYATIQQKRRHEELRLHGAEVHVVGNLEDAKRILK